MRIVVVGLSLLLAIWPAFGHGNYIGYSGAPGSRGTCSSSCHGLPGGTVQVTGFPAQYVPNQSYLITIQRLSGDLIRNFNSSIRVGTGSANAGTITAGTATSTYDVPQETNGVHFTSVSQATGTFNWQAPAAGTGTVRLYLGALQGSDPDLGLYSTIVQVSDEQQLPPPAPTGLVIHTEPPSVDLHWNPATGAALYNVYRDTTASVTIAPATLVATTPDTAYVDPVAITLPGYRYFYAVTALRTP